jgi:PIN domain nuclease of toxin-antitoxin system
MLNLDTHILLFALTGQVTPGERRLLAAHEWSISGIVLWEIARLAELGRISIDLDDRELGRAITRLHTWPVDLEVCRQLARLDVRGDPADDLIAATSLAHDVPLLTRDRRLRRSRKVPLARAG